MESDLAPVNKNPSDIAEAILDIILEYSLSKFESTSEQHAIGRAKFLAVIETFLRDDKELLLALPAFPFKSANKVDKVLGLLPDKAEELSLLRLNSICTRIKQIYPPGANLTIVSDGLVYNDLLGISDQHTWIYGSALREMAERLQLEHISFSRIRDLVEFSGPKELNVITYVASVTNFRRSLLNEFGDDKMDIEARIKAEPDTMLTYLGYRRFLKSDLRHIFPVNENRSMREYKSNVKFLAQEMLRRGYAFAGVCKKAFPNHLRLSIHQSTGENKISISLLNTKTAYTTPWHCTVALMANGEWLSSQRSDFDKDPRFKIVEEFGRPSYYQEQIPSDLPIIISEPVDVAAIPDIDAKNTTGKDIMATSTTIVAYATSHEASQESDSNGDISASQTPGSAARSLVNENDSINVFSVSDDPQLDPTSKSFDTQTWLKSVMTTVDKDPGKFPRRTAGVAFRQLSVHVNGSAHEYQPTFGNQLFKVADAMRKVVGRSRSVHTKILQDFQGLVRSGEMLLVLGRPGSGCSTFLKSISGQLGDLEFGNETYINFQGTDQELMHKEFRGECIYQAEIDVHFPTLTVGQTLDFAARARAPQNLGPEIEPEVYADQVKGVALQAFGLTHTVDTMVGNEFFRGVSGGEKKRVSIAEAAVSGSPIQCWDNSTRGLDSATALNFVKTIHSLTDLTGATALVSLYQVAQSIYDIFDKVTVLYEGRQIYFGSTADAARYFENLGFERTVRQTTADFVTSVTNPAERRVRAGFKGKTPRNAEEFASVWRKSSEAAALAREIDQFDRTYPIGGESHEQFKLARNSLQSKMQRPQSPYILSMPKQIGLCIHRGMQRLKSDAGITITGIVFNIFMALIIGSVFYNLPNDTSSLYSRGALLFFAILLAAFASGLEILTLYAQRPIVEKHLRYAFYQPVAEAISSMLCDLPAKLLTTITFDLVLYFMTNLRRTPGAFFIFLLFTIMCTLTMSMYFRSIAALSRSLAQALAPSSVFCLALVLYTGFAIPEKLMHPWFKWIIYINPVSYAFQALMINEFRGRRIPCARFVPEGQGYDGVTNSERVCSAIGAVAGQDYVNGDDYLIVNFRAYPRYLWRNFGILIALMVLGCVVYLVATAKIREKQSKGEVLLFPRSKRTGYVIKNPEADVEVNLRGGEKILKEYNAHEAGEKPAPKAGLRRQAATLHWEDVNYDLKLKKETRRLLNDVDGWVKPGTLTILMGVSGAGKTTLLDVLASRINHGVTGDILVDGRPRNAGFQRETCYAQQADLHMSTSTIREALIFSALLRQSKLTPREEKLAYVDEVIKILEMESYADAIIGTPGEGLNIEQRKRLTIGVELAAKPALLLFLDEPTSGLDSQSAWSIVKLLRKLADNGQTILCTLHQPSAELFETFDRLLYLAMEGKPVYFGDIGNNSSVVTQYFEKKGARTWRTTENPAEYIFEVCNEPVVDGVSWPEIWSASDEKQQIKKELAELKSDLLTRPTTVDLENDPGLLKPYAASFTEQLRLVLYRNFQQYWRTPSYLNSKVALCLLSSLFIGFSFWNSRNSLQGLQNQLYAIFLLLSLFPNLSNQILPLMLARRQLYEARERLAKTYSWQVFVIADIFVEIPWNSVMAVIMFCAWYYPSYLQVNAEVAGQTAERGGLMFLFIMSLMVYVGTFASMALAAVETAEAAGMIMNLLFSLSLIFCGVLATPEVLPGFWIFMYRVSPLTYMVSGMLSTGLANAPLTCAADEYLRFAPPAQMNCFQYLEPYINQTGGYITRETLNSTVECAFCTASETNAFLRSVHVEYSDRWRNFGIFWAYVLFNLVAAVGLFWLSRVRKGR